MKGSRLVLVLLLLLAFLQYATFSPRLPDRVASHFDALGRADGWSSKPAFFAANLVMVLGLAAMFLLIGWIVRKMPFDAINLPNKAYWLAEERRDATFAYLEDQMTWMGAATVAFLVGLFQLSIEANLKTDGAMPGSAFWLLFGGFMAIFVVWIVRFIGKWYWEAKA